MNLINQINLCDQIHDALEQINRLIQNQQQQQQHAILQSILVHKRQKGSWQKMMFFFLVELQALTFCVEVATIQPTMVELKLKFKLPHHWGPTQSRQFKKKKKKLIEHYNNINTNLSRASNKHNLFDQFFKVSRISHSSILTRLINKRINNKII